MRSMWMLGGCGVGLLVLTACPEVERVKLTVDRKAKTLELVYEGLRSDDPDKAEEDLASFVKMITESPDAGEDTTYNVVSSEFYEADGRLDAKMNATFDDLESIGFYRHDRRSPTLFCVDRNSDQSIVSTNGKNLQGVLPGCVAWDRKVNDLTVTIGTQLDEDSYSLLPTYQASQKK